MGGERGLRVMYANVQSLNNKVNELRALVVLESPDVIALTETWTNDSVANEFLYIEGYDMVVRKDRMDTAGGRGGGIIVYVKDVFAWQEEVETSFNQCALVKVKRRARDLGLRIVYRSPNSTRDNDAELCQWIGEMRKEEVLLGDFNFPGIRWGPGCSDARGRPFYEACSEVFLTQHVEGPTHLSGNTLDLVLSSDPGMVRRVEMIGRIGSSDHETLMVHIQSDVVTRSAGGKSHDWYRAKFTEMRRELSIDWEMAMRNMNVQEMWDVFKMRVNTAIENHVPLRQNKRIGKPKWLSREILVLIEKKRKAWCRWKACASAEREREYKGLEKLVKKKIRNSKNCVERKVAKEAKENPKAFFSYVNGAKRARGKIGPLSDREGNIIIDPGKQAGIFNAHYATVFTKSETDPPVIGDMTRERIVDIEISVERVMNTIDELKEHSAPGPDNIGNRVLKEMKDQLSFPLSILFRKSLDDGDVPGDWKESAITPIYKKGKRSDPGNYRPVNLTSNTCKLMEKVVKVELERHLENHVTGNSQHGFRRGRSPQTNLIEFMDQLTKWVDEGRSVDVVYFDFSKAFDKVCHKRLAVKLEAAGVQGKVKEWICEWLRGRRQKVVVEGAESGWEDVKSSVPQGTVLGGVLFNLYVNDIDVGIESFVRKFANDTKMARIVEEDDDALALQRDIDGMMEWARKWEMKFNVDKCKVLHVGRLNKRYRYRIGDVDLVEAMEEKDLGVWIGNDLKPVAQCERAAKAANSALGLITRCFHYRTKSVLVPLYKTFVRPKLEYAVAVWSPWLKRDEEVMEKVQQRFVRLLSDVRGDSYEAKLKSAGLTTLSERRTRGDMIETFKTMRGINRVNRDDWFRVQVEEEHRPTRSNMVVVGEQLERRQEVIIGQRARLEVRRNFFTVRVEKEWNALPETVKMQRSVNGFKNAYDRWRQTASYANNYGEEDRVQAQQGTMHDLV